MFVDVSNVGRPRAAILPAAQYDIFHVASATISRMSTPDTPLFVKTHDFLLWLILHTQRFPKNLRHTYMHKLETIALEFREAILMANAVRGQQRSQWLTRAEGKLLKAKRGRDSLI